MSEEALDCLAETEKLVVKQEVSALEIAANLAANAVDMDVLGNLGEVANKYDVYTDDGGKKFRVVESSEYCGLTGRCCCNPNHELKLHVFRPDYSSTESIMTFDRPCKLGCCAFMDICRQEISVLEGSSGAPIALVKQPIMGGGFSPQLDIMDREGGELQATIKAEACCFIGGICCDHTFTATDPDGNYIGKIVKERPEGLGEAMKEMMSDADIFTFYVKKEVDVKKKASMLAALHLLDYMFFENEGDLNLDFVNQKCSFKCCDMYLCGCKVPCACNCGGDGDSDGDGDGDGGGDE